jgi:hypothetical protein
MHGESASEAERATCDDQPSAMLKDELHTDQVSDSAGATELRPRHHCGHNRRVQDWYSDEVAA